MNLKPSEIRFSQDSINNYFDKRSSHSYKTIGNTLDDLCEGRCSITNIPTITVVNEGACWITADNRRLWVFRELERLGKCDTIPVQRGYSIPSAKRTSRNGGKSIFVRRNPGGEWHSKPTVRVDSCNHSVGNPSTHDRTEDRGSGTPTDNQKSVDVRRTASAHLRPEYVNPSPTPSKSRRPEDGYGISTASVPDHPRYLYDTLGIPRYGFARQTYDPLASHQRSDDMISYIDSFGARVARYTYGVRVMRRFIPGVHPEEKKIIIDGVASCRGCFSKHVVKGQTLEIGQSFGWRRIHPVSSNPIRSIHSIIIYRSDDPNPLFVDEDSCSFRGKVAIDLRRVPQEESRAYDIEMVFDGTHLVVTSRIEATGEMFKAKIR